MKSKPTADLTLLIPSKPDAERDGLASAWTDHGGKVIRLDRFWDPPTLDKTLVRVYGGTSFVLVLQQKLGFELCTPSDELIFSLPQSFLKRQVKKKYLKDAKTFAYPIFVKPVVPKSFQARVYKRADQLLNECEGLEPDTAVFVSDAVTFSSEARAFILEGKVLDCAFYEGTGNKEEATHAAGDFAQDKCLPRAFVIDIGLIPGTGWAVVEINAAWGAGLNGCDPNLIWPSIAAASGPQH